MLYIETFQINLCELKKQKVNHNFSNIFILLGSWGLTQVVKGWGGFVGGGFKSQWGQKFTYQFLFIFLFCYILSQFSQIYLLYLKENMIYIYESKGPKTQGQNRGLWTNSLCPSMKCS